MISISPSKTADSGSSYFEKDSYYASGDKTSHWYGKGAQDLGLSGPVKKDEFDIVINGFNLDKKALVRNSGSDDKRNEKGEVIKVGRTAYIDLTFSAPKSVSLMSYVDPRIEEAHNRAVERACKEIEDNFTFTRKLVNEELKTEQENSALIARINHYESRECEPQLHSHLVLMNLTHGEDGKWRSRENSKIYQNQMYLGQLYRNELSRELERIGYQIEVTDRRQGLYEIKGISREIIEDFSTRRKQIKESVKKYEDYGVSDAQKREYACLDSRKNKTDSKVEEIREKTNGKLTEKYGKTLEEIKRESLLLSREAGPVVSKEDAVKMAIDEVTDKQSGFRREVVLSHAMKATLGKCSLDELSEVFDRDSSISILGERSRFSKHAKNTDLVYTTGEILKTEQGIMEWARNVKTSSDTIITPEKINEHFDRLTGRGVVLTDGQRQAVEMICTTRDQMSLVQGDSGAGKSFAMGQVKEIMEAEGYTVRGFAPTGKASQELNKAGIEAITLDKLFVSKQLQAEFKRGEVWLVDEAGMVGSRKMESLVRLAGEKRAKVVLIGDSKQFQSVEQGKLFSDLQKYSDVAYAEILEVKRQKTEMAKEIVKAIKERDFDRAFETLEKGKSLHEIKNAGERHEAIAEAYLKDVAGKKDCVILSQTNETKNELNRIVRDRLVGQGSIEKGESFSMYQKAAIDKVTCHFVESYREGQKIIFNKDCDVVKPEAGAAGEPGRSIGVEARIVRCDRENNSLHIQFWDKAAAKFREADVNLLKHGKKFQTYDIVSREFGAGDKVMFTKNDGKVRVSNGEIGRIEKIDRDGTATIRMTDNDKREVTCNLKAHGNNGYTYLDHAHCITDHKSQGATFDTVIVANDVSKVKSSFNSFYVEATRMRQHVSVFTNDKESLKEQVRREQDKISTFDTYDFSKYEKAMAKNREDITQERKAADELREIKEGLEASIGRAKERVKEGVGKADEKQKREEISLERKGRGIDHGLEL